MTADTAAGSAFAAPSPDVTGDDGHDDDHGGGGDSGHGGSGHGGGDD